MKFFSSLLRAVIVVLTSTAFCAPALAASVSSTADSGPGSLRQAILDASVDETITFGPSLNGQTITLTSGHLAIDQSLSLDASTLPDGLVINANGTSRAFAISAGTTVTLTDMTISGGKAPNGATGANGSNGTSLPFVGTGPGGNGKPGGAGGNGGGILNHGTLTLNRVTMLSNAAGNGGKGGNGGSGSPTGAGGAGGNGGNGGALYNSATGTALIINCTVTENHGGSGGSGGSGSQIFGGPPGAGGTGGGISNLGTLTVTHATVTGNAAGMSAATVLVPSSPNTGGGIQSSGSLTLNNSILALNTGSPQADLAGSVTAGSGDNLIGGDPLLSPLGNYGGPTQTMYPLPGSAAVDAGGFTTLSTDQRGRPRVADGNGDDAAAPDIGAYEVGNSTVTSVADSGPGSLRSLIDAHSGHERIRFNTDPTMGDVFDGSPSSTITLASALEVSGGDCLSIDASGIPGGVTLSGNNVTQVMFLFPLGIVEMDSLTITQGHAAAGGAIYNGGTLTLNNATLSGNFGTNGSGAIYNSSGKLTANNCTFSGNATNGSGGAIGNNLNGIVILNHSTFAGNSAGDMGGAIETSATLLGIHNSIIAGNTAAGSSPDIDGLVNEHSGVNFIGDPTGATGLGTPGVDYLTGDAMLAPLGDYGGPTQTMPPQAGSPAIDAAIGGATATDQRGLARPLDGDRDGTAISDIGAVEFFEPVVASSSEAGPGSLREILSIAYPGTTITFDPSLDGQTITLAGTQLLLDKDLTIDASALPRGITISGNKASRVFEIAAGIRVSMTNLSITGGYTASDGGGILNHGDLHLNQCSVTHNIADSRGGGIYNNGFSGNLNITNSAIIANTSVSFGGGITAWGLGSNGSNNEILLQNVTIYGNRCLDEFGGGGGVFCVRTKDTSKLINVTIAGNIASAGGGIICSGIHLESTIIANNVATRSGTHDLQGSPRTHTGVNFIGNLAGTSGLGTEGVDYLTGDPMLSTPGFYGGPTQTVHPLAGSPVIDAVTTGLGLSTDQRGISRPIDGDQDGSAAPDIGAVEAYPAVTVTSTADSGSGSLRQAILDARVGEGITFAPALDGQTITLTSGQLLLDEDLFIDGSNLSQGITLDANGTSRVFTISADSSVTLTGMTISGGKAPDGADGAVGIDATFITQRGGKGGAGQPGTHGGGILNHGSLVLHHVTLTGNVAGNGGRGGDGGSGEFPTPGGGTGLGPQGVPGEGAPGGSGGALFNSITGTVVIEDCTITNNASGAGGDSGTGFGPPIGASGGAGGGLANSGELTITQTTIAYNDTGAPGDGSTTDVRFGPGGGVQNSASGTLTVTDSTIAANNGGDGGGLWSAGDAVLTQCTVTANTARFYREQIFGGGVYTAGPSLLIDQCTITGNSATLGAGGGLYAISSGASNMIKHTIIANNTAGDLIHFAKHSGTEIELSGINLFWPIAVTPPVVGQAPLYADPLLSPLGDYGGPTQTMYLLPGSAAIDAGGVTTLNTDQRGRPRLADGDGDGAPAPDIGAYEVGESLVTSFADSGPGSLRSLIDAQSGHERISFNTDATLGDVFDGSPSSTIILASELEVSGGILHLDASALPDGLVIDAKGTSRVFEISADSTVTLTGMTIRGGKAPTGATGLDGDNSVSIPGLVEAGLGGRGGTGGPGENGGGILNHGKLTLNRVTMVSNAAGNGGVGGNGGSGNPQGSGGAGGVGGSGGALYNSDTGTALFINCAITNNQGGSGGMGGTGSTQGVAGASGSVGGGIFNLGTLTLNNCTISGNSAGAAGGIYNGSTATLKHCTISANLANSPPGFGGGGILSFSFFGTPHLNLSHCIVAGNSALYNPNFIGTLTTSSHNLIDEDPRLAPLGDYGGPTQTMPLLVGSPAIDAGVSSGTTPATDQRGFPRVVGTAPDIGAIEAGPVVLVSNSNDSGAGSLRNALSAATAPGARILFNLSSTDDTVQLSGSELTIEDGQTVFLDASSRVEADGTVASAPPDEVPRGATVVGGGSRVFNINSGGNAAMHGLEISGGYLPTGSGGGILNQGTLTLNDATIAGNVAMTGGAIASSGRSLALNNSTIMSNEARQNGGGLYLYQNGSATFTNTTIANNRASTSGGGVYLDQSGGTRITSSTIADNTASGGNGGGIRLNSGTLALTNSIVGDNSAGLPGPDLDSDGTVVSSGVNLLGDLYRSGLSAGPDVIVGAPFLSALADHGGPTWTMALQGNSPAIDAGVVIDPLPFFDQRAYPRLLANGLDIGAFESATGDFNASGLTLYAKVEESLATPGPLRFEVSTNKEFLLDVLTVAGTGVIGSTNNSDVSSQFSYPSDLTQDQEGNLFVADSGNHMIRMISRGGGVSTIAGTGSFGFANGDGDEAKFAFPSGITLGPDNNLYVADTLNHVIRKLTRPVVDGLPWKVSTLAGYGFAGFMDGIGRNSLFSHPHGITVNEVTGDLYVADTANHRIRKITPQGVVSTWAGSGAVGADDGYRLTARFFSPYGVAADPDGNLFVADRDNHRIRMVGTDSQVTTIAGSSDGFSSGPGPTAKFREPCGVAIDADGNLAVADGGNHAIRKIARPGNLLDPWLVTTAAGTGDAGFLDGIASDTGAQFSHPTGVLVTADGDILVADEQNHRIRKIGGPIFVEGIKGAQDPYGRMVHAVLNAEALNLRSEVTYYFRWVAGASTQMVGQSFVIVAVPTVVTTPASQLTRTSASINGTIDPHGSPTSVTFDYSTDPDLAGPLTVASLPPGFDDPEGMAVDDLGNIYVADRNTHKILRIDPSGAVSDFAGTGTAGFADGPRATAQFDQPVDLAIDAAGNLYVADELNQRIRKITPAGLVSTIAGSGVAGDRDDAVATQGELIFPCGVAVNEAGTRIIVADRGNQRIRVISGGGLSTLAGSGTAGFANGAGDTAQFNNPTAVALDAAGNVYVADRDNHRIRMVETNGLVSTLAGSGAEGFFGGSGPSARFAFPAGLAIDADGNLYVADTGNYRLRLISPAGMVSTMAGSGLEGVADLPATGTLFPATSAQFSAPSRVAVGPDGSIFLSEQGGQEIRQISRSPLPSITLPRTYDQNGPLDLGAPIPETLLLGTTYYFRARASNSQGAAQGEILSFTTPGNQQITVFAETATGAAALSDGQSEAIDFDLTPRGVPVTRQFTIDNIGEWDLEVTAINVPAGYVSAGGIGTIAPGASLTFDLTLTAAAGGAFSGDLEILSDDPGSLSFSFPVAGVVLDPPTVTTLEASDFADDGATLNASINPEDSETTVWFEYSEDPELDAVEVATLAGTLFDRPSGLALDGAGNLYIADTNNHRIRRIAPDGTSSTIAGTGVAGFANGPGASAQFNEPVGVAIDSAGTLFVTDSKNHRIRAISSAGEVTTHSGLGVAGFTNGADFAARFNHPAGLAIDASGVLYVADRMNHRIRKVTPDGTASTLAGTGSAGYLDGAGDAARFDRPLGIVVSGSGRVHVTEAGNHAIRRIEPDGTVSTLAGFTTPGFTDDLGSAARFSSPAGLALDAGGQLFVADQDNHCIRLVTEDGSVTTFAGSGTPGSLDGLGELAEFDQPGSLASGLQGDLFVGDLTNSSIRHITSATTVVQVASGLTGVADQALALPLSGINPGTTYYFRAFATNGGGTTSGEIKNFSLLIPPPLSPFQAWLIANFGPDAGDPLVAAPLAAPNADGISNLETYAFMLDSQPNRRDGLPTTEWDGSLLSITYTKVLAATDLAYTVQWSTDLRTWSSVGITEEILEDDGVTQSIRASVSGDSADQIFIRIGLTLQ